MNRRHRPLLAIVSLLFLAACDDDEPATPEGVGGTRADAGSSGATGSGGATGATSDCEVVYSCRTQSSDLVLNCIEASAEPNGAKEACEGQSTGGLTYVYAEGPCLRQGAAAGLIRKGAACQVGWIYGEGGGANAPAVELFNTQCREQGHAPVVP